MERLYRFSIPGLTAFLTIWYFTFALTGRNVVLDLNLGNDNRVALALLSAFLSSPIVGLILTSLLHLITHSRLPWFKIPGPYWLYLPGDIDKRIFDRFYDNTLPIDRQWKDFYWKYQSYGRANLDKETWEFIARRWTTFNIHFNNIWCLILGFGLSVIISIFITQFSSYGSGQINFAFLFMGVIVMLSYTVAALRLAWVAMGDATYVEQQSVLDAMEKEQGKKGQCP